MCTGAAMHRNGPSTGLCDFYIAFFPQLLAGPIERASAFLKSAKTGD